MRRVGSTVEGTAVVGAQHTVFARDRIPLLAIVRLLDQRISEVAKLPLVVRQCERRGRNIGIREGLAIEPIVDAVGDQVRPYLSEITIGTASEQQQRRE